MKPDKLVFLILCIISKLEELQDHKVVPSMLHTFDLLLYCLVQSGSYCQTLQID